MLSVLRKTALCGHSSAKLFTHTFSRPSNGTSLQTIMVRLIGNTKGNTKLKKQTLLERLLSPTTDPPFIIGRGVVAGSAIIGIVALCYYGLVISHSASIYKESSVWNKHLRDRIHTTYMYFGSALGLTAVAAIGALRSPVLMRNRPKSQVMALILVINTLIGTRLIVHFTPYSEGFGAKQMAWVVHCGATGAIIASMFLWSGPIISRAACYTAGIVGSLSVIAGCAPSDEFLNMGRPLNIMLAAVLASIAVLAFLGASLYSLNLYGGLVLFSAFLVYDTQGIVRTAKSVPVHADTPFDPINASIWSYFYVIMVFIRVLRMVT